MGSACRKELVKISRAITSVENHLGLEILQKKPKRSNSTEQELSLVNLQTETILAMRWGGTKTLERWRGRLELGNIV
jgi:hypothetical protein